MTNLKLAFRGFSGHGRRQVPANAKSIDLRFFSPKTLTLHPTRAKPLKPHTISSAVRTRCFCSSRQVSPEHALEVTGLQAARLLGRFCVPNDAMLRGQQGQHGILHRPKLLGGHGLHSQAQVPSVALKHGIYILLLLHLVQRRQDRQNVITSFREPQSSSPTSFHCTEWKLHCASASATCAGACL